MPRTALPGPLERSDGASGVHRAIPRGANREEPMITNEITLLIGAIASLLAAVAELIAVVRALK